MLQGWLHTSDSCSSALCYGESGGKLAHDNSIKLHLFILTSYFAVRRYAPRPIAVDVHPCVDRSTVRTALVACRAAVAQLA